MTHPKQASAASGPALSAPVRRALSTAADRAADRLIGRSDDSASVFRAEMKHLADHVYGLALAKNGSTPDAVSLTFSAELVDMLRAEFVSQFENETHKRVTGREILAVLSAMERVSSRGRANAGSQSSSSASANSEALNGMLEIAHDMRSPLNAILLLVEPIRRGQQGPVTPIQERQLGLVYGAALGLASLANDVIDAARGECLGTLSNYPFSIAEMVEEACAVVRPIAEEKQLQLLQSLPKNDHRVGDAGAIQRVLLNLTSNALKYTEQGSVTVGCTELDATRVEFWVKDTGRGIPDHVLEHLFDEFRPGPIGSRFFSAGLGLTICRRLLKSMNSTLEVKTELEKGTRFSFVLELASAG